MTLKEIEDRLVALNRDAQRSGCPTPFKVDCYELSDLADALKAERERIEALIPSKAERERDDGKDS